jgi:hypothetical protein
MAETVPSNPATDTHRKPRIAVLRRGLALGGALLASTATPAEAATRLAPNHSPQSATTAQATSARAPTTVIKETVVKSTNSNPTLPITLSAAALAVALAAAAHTFSRRTDRVSQTRQPQPTQEERS